MRCLRCAPLKLLPSQPHLSAQVNLRGNKFGEVGWCTIFDTLRDNPQNKISKWDLSFEGINPTIVKSLAGYAAVSASLTEVCGRTRMPVQLAIALSACVLCR